MRQMGLCALYPKPRTSQPGHRHTTYPYRVRGLRTTQPNQVRASDICYIAYGERVYVSDGHHGLVCPPSVRLARV